MAKQKGMGTINLHGVAFADAYDGAWDLETFTFHAHPASSTAFEEIDAIYYGYEDEHPDVSITIHTPRILDVGTYWHDFLLTLEGMYHSLWEVLPTLAPSGATGATIAEGEAFEPFGIGHKKYDRALWRAGTFDPSKLTSADGDYIKGQINGKLSEMQRHFIQAVNGFFGVENHIYLDTLNCPRWTLTMSEVDFRIAQAQIDADAYNSLCGDIESLVNQWRALESGDRVEIFTPWNFGSQTGKRGR